MTIRKHLKDGHEKNAEFHIGAAKAHRKLATFFGKSEMVEGSKNLADAHEELAKAHTDQAAYHISCCKELSGTEKALTDGDLDKIAPDHVSAINRYPERGVQLTPRHGQPLNSEISKIDPAFQELLKIE